MTYVLIGIPNTGSVKEATVAALVGLLANTRGARVSVALQQGAVLPENRWRLAHLALEEQASHLFFLDADIACPDDTLTRLLAHGRPFVGAEYQSRSQFEPHSTVRLLHHERPTASPFECHSLGFGCVLIAAEVLRAVPQPWFDYGFAASGRPDKGEDVWFCEAARAAGYAPWCDPTIPVRHIGDWAY